MAAEKMTMASTTRIVGAAILAFGVWHEPSIAQSPAASPGRVIIPFLASANRPADLEFEGVECERDPKGKRMECTFQQVFLTTSAIVPETCLITTNRYARTFDLDRESANRWVSREGPEGVCGIVDIVTLHDTGNGRWTMETRKVATKPDGAANCGTLETGPETLSGQNIRRPLPCRFVQPGGLVF
jgi:hypothetical protein